MTDKEYNKAKEECWKAVKKEFGLHYWGGPTLDIVSHTFDYAYALGKQTETITQEEIERRQRNTQRKKWRMCLHGNGIPNMCKV